MMGLIKFLITTAVIAYVGRCDASEFHSVIDEKFEALVTAYCESNHEDQETIDGLMNCIYHAVEADPEIIKDCHSHFFPKASDLKEFYCEIKDLAAARKIVPYCYIGANKEHDETWTSIIEASADKQLAVANQIIDCTAKIVGKL